MRQRKLFSRHRVAINLGSKDRHFIFVPLGLAELAELYEIPHLASKEEDGEAVKDYVLNHSQKPSLYCVTLPPGSGYIAMTDYLIHDGWFGHLDAYDFHLDFRVKLKRHDQS